MGKHLRFILPAGLAAAVVLAFLPVLNADFVNWDDNVNIVRNPFYRGLGPANLSWMFTTFHMGHYQPLAWLTLAVDYLVWGMNPLGYHLTNLLLHAANAILCYLVFLNLLRRLRPEPGAILNWAAAAGALVYAIHPLRVESVAWVTERRDVLCGLFFLLSILAYLRMTRAQAGGEKWGKWLALSCAAFAASLLSKALGIMLPFLLLALDIYPLKRFTPALRKRALLEKVPYLALAFADGLIMMRAMAHIGQVRPAGGYAIGDRLLQAGYGLWFYAWKSLLPTGLHALYALGDSISLWRAEYVWPLIGTTAITAALIALRRRWPAGLAAWVCYAILLTPVLGFFVKGYQRSADRYSYLSCIPLSFLASVGVAALIAAKQSGRLSRSGFRAAGGGIGIVLVVLGLLTYSQAGVWKNSLTLFNRVLEHEERADLPYVNRGSARLENGDVAGALADYSQALRVNPRSIEALNDRGQIRQELGDFDAAVADYSAAIAIDPTTYEAYNNRASLRSLRKDWDGALSDVDQALALRSYEPEPYAIRARVRQAKGYVDGAIDDCNAALRVAPAGWRYRKNVESMLESLRKQKAGR